jgi:flagellar basal-body rod protein FlgG
MNDALYIAATGMQAQQTNVETIANNLVNSSTTAYKRSRVSFTDMVSAEAGRSSQQASVVDANLLVPAQRNGAGVAIAALTKQFDLGTVTKTDSTYDLAINGDGFFSVTMPDGSTAYTRGGTLRINSDGQLATQAGYPLKPGIAIPADAQSMAITASGHVQILGAGQTVASDAGQLELVRFSSPGQLSAQGDNLYRATDKSDEPLTGDGIGAIQQGYLEGSNISMVDEMVNLMVAQRAYESSVKVVQASDEMLGMINNLRR